MEKIMNNKKKLITNKIVRRLSIDNKNFARGVKNGLSYCGASPRAFKLFFIISLMFFVLVILLTKFALGNFVCGQVLDSEENMSASWFNVRIFYLQDIEKFASCQISPAGNKYCCDTEAIPGKGWKIGDIVAGEIFDNETGYVAGQVSVITSGEGYSVFPEMKLEKVIKIYNPDSRLIFLNDSMFLLNASFKEPYNFVEIENSKTGNKSILCLNCSKIEQNINADFGMNYLKIIARFGNRVFSENIVLALLRSFVFERKIECEKCRGNIVKSGQIANITLSINLSEHVEGLELKEYIPVNWEILETDGEIKGYSETHNLIVWNVSGKNIIKKYTVKAPRINFFPRKYIFRTELEDKLLAENEIIVRGFFPFFSSEEKFKFKDIKKAVYSRIYPDKPLVIRSGNKEIIRIAVFPNKVIKNAEFDLRYSEEKLDEVIGYYTFESNFEENIEKIFLEFKIEKEFFEKYENVSLLVLNKEEGWQEAETEVYEDDKNYIYYKAFIEPCKGIAFVGKNKKGAFSSFFSSLIEIFS